MASKRATTSSSSSAKKPRSQRITNFFTPSSSSHQSGTNTNPIAIQDVVSAALPQPSAPPSPKSLPQPAEEDPTLIRDAEYHQMRAIIAFSEIITLLPSAATPILQAHDWDVAAAINSYMNDQTEDELQLVA